jgi:hypothetical protein
MRRKRKLTSAFLAALEALTDWQMQKKRKQ